MEKRIKPKKAVLTCLYLTLFALLVASTYLVSKNMEKEVQQEQKPNYVTETITDDNSQYDEEPVINENTPKKIIKPYLNEQVKVGKSFYDYKGESKAQENSITYYDGSYIQNSGIDYVLNETFDVVSILEGTVTDVKDDEVLGKVVEIKHGNDYVSMYQSLSEVSVKKGDNVAQGQVIGKSGTNKLDKDMGNHLHFELYTNGQVVDPNNYIDKEIKSE